YAEADPRGDVEGDDAANKLVVLARLAFGRWLDIGSVVRAPDLVGGGLGLPGITGVTIEDIASAAARGFVIKLIASAVRVDGEIAASVVPSAVPAAAPLGRTDGVINRIEVDGEPVGRVAFAGPGAGGPATSSAVLGDLIAIGRGAGSTWAGLAAAMGAFRAAQSLPGETFDAPSGARYPVVR
ncbi:MAG: homoserine dehydrogenase, partial [Chloroflexi bacterium]|nr:homoserine dehydrogenase [Chloroflexota bacterium]